MSQPGDKPLSHVNPRNTAAKEERPCLGPVKWVIMDFPEQQGSFFLLNVHPIPQFAVLTQGKFPI